MTTKKNYLGKRTVTPVGRCAFMSVFVPKKQLNGDDKYEVTLLFPKDTDLSELKTSVNELVKGYYGDSIPPNLRNPFKDGDEPNSKGKTPDGYAGCTVVRASSVNEPGVLDAQKVEIVNPKDFKSGDYGRASMTPFVYDAGNNAGVSFFLNNIQKAKDGEPFGTFVKPEDEFGEINTGGTDKKGVFDPPKEAAEGSQETPDWMK